MVCDVMCGGGGAEVVPEYLPLNNGGLLVISQSGETKDTHRALMHAEAQMMPRFSIVNQVCVLLARPLPPLLCRAYLMCCAVLCCAVLCCAVLC
jgi:hypothetical protein